MKEKKGSAGKRAGRKLADILLTMLLLVCLIAAGCAVYYIVTTLADYRASDKAYESVTELAVSVVEVTEITYETSDDDEEEASAYVCPLEVDFEALWAVNPDVVAWLYIPATETSYPVLQGDTNDEYIHTTIEGSTALAGSIFMESANSYDFSDANTIIYGHSMKNGSMFGKLKYFLNSGAYDICSYFWIITPDASYRYEIFSIYQTESTSDTYTLFENPGELFTTWCRKMLSQDTIVGGDFGFTEDSKVVTLSTCAAATGTGRRIIQGVRVED